MAGFVPSGSAAEVSCLNFALDSHAKCFYVKCHRFGFQENCRGYLHFRKALSPPVAWLLNVNDFIYLNLNTQEQFAKSSHLLSDSYGSAT